MDNNQKPDLVSPAWGISPPALADTLGNSALAFQKRVSETSAAYVELWRTLPGSTPPLGRVYGPGEQAERELRADRELQALKTLLREFPKPQKERPGWRAKLLDQAREIAGGTLGLDEEGLRWFFTAEGLEATQHFVRQARKFDPQMSESSLHQALRNLWVMQSIQLLLRQKVGLTPPVFAYSMLYPFTDNFLDDPGHSAESKRQFCEWLGQRLRGHRSSPPDHHAAQVGQLVANIESTFPRAEFEEVYLSLEAIHEAQTASLEQHGPHLSAEDLLPVTVRKGGTSVLADAYLIRGQLTEAEAHFMFGYGVLLQFMDDLQDFEEDLAVEHATIFSRQAAEGPLDKLSSQFWHFSQAILAPSPGFEAPALRAVKALLRDNCLLILLQTIARHPRFFTAGYARQMEPCSPFSFQFMAARPITLHKEYSGIMTQLRRRGRIECALDLLN